MLRDIDVKQLREEIENDLPESDTGVLRFVLRGGGWEIAPMNRDQARNLILCWHSCSWKADANPLWLSPDAMSCVDLREVVTMNFYSNDEEDQDEAESWH